MRIAFQFSNMQKDRFQSIKEELDSHPTTNLLLLYAPSYFKTEKMTIKGASSLHPGGKIMVSRALNVKSRQPLQM